MKRLVSIILTKERMAWKERGRISLRAAFARTQEGMGFWKNSSSLGSGRKAERTRGKIEGLHWMIQSSQQAEGEGLTLQLAGWGWTWDWRGDRKLWNNRCALCANSRLQGSPQRDCLPRAQLSWIFSQENYKGLENVHRRRTKMIKEMWFLLEKLKWLELFSLEAQRPNKMWSKFILWRGQKDEKRQSVSPKLAKPYKGAHPETWKR